MAETLQYRFPGGKSKALVMSYDDGSEHDRHLVELFNRYGIRASFHLNTGKLGQDHHINPQEVKSLYQGHEVSCHTVNHPDLTQLDEAAIRREILEDRLRLEDLTAAPVRGLAYPFGTYNDKVLSLLPELGIEYARTVTNTNDFTISENFLTWHTSCHHSQAMTLAEQFLGGCREEMELFYVWGHSYELAGFMTADPSKDWDYLEAFCRLLHGHADIHYTTTIELVDYLNALRKLEATSENVLANHSDSTVWIRWQDTIIELPPRETCFL